MRRSLTNWSAYAACLAWSILQLPAQTAGTLTTIYNFPAAYGQPGTGVVIGGSGVLYGTFGLTGGGIFTLSRPVTGSNWTYSTLYEFAAVMVYGAGYGVIPTSPTLGPGGVIYGANGQGGITAGNCSVHIAGCGTVYSLTPPSSPGGSWTLSYLYEFTGGADGAWPSSAVVIGPGGVLYGTTEMRAAGAGTVYSLTPPSTPGGAWTEATIFTFTGGADGGVPIGNLATDSNGVLYGTTNYGGSGNHGTVYSLTPPASPGSAWTETVLYRFSGPDGAVPNGGVLLGAGGVLYGSTEYGNTAKAGVVYSLSPPTSPGGAWTETVLHTFPMTTVWGGPYPGPLAQGPDGVLYGATSLGGADQHGSVFALKPPAPGESEWTFLTLASMASPGGTLPTYGYYTPGETLAVGTGGEIYGTASDGGAAQYYGTVFMVRP